MPFISALPRHAVRTSIWSISCMFAVEMHFFGKATIKALQMQGYFRHLAYWPG